MAVGILEFKIYIPQAHSLKEKRHQLLPLLNHLRKKFNISVAETDLQDVWHSSIITGAFVCTDPAIAQRTLLQVLEAVEKGFPNVAIESESIELL